MVALNEASITDCGKGSDLGLGGHQLLEGAGVARVVAGLGGDVGFHGSSTHNCTCSR